MTKRHFALTVCVAIASVATFAGMPAFSGASSHANGLILADGGSFSGVRGLLMTAGPNGEHHRQTPFPLGSIAVSPRGDKLAVAGKYGLYVYDSAARHGRRISRLATGYGGSVAFSPDGRRLVIDRPERRETKGWPIYTLHIDGTHVQKLRGARGFQPRWSPDGRQIAFIRPYRTRTVIDRWGDLDIVSASGGTPRRLYRPPSNHEGAASFEWSPSGRELVVDVQDNGPGCEGAPPESHCSVPPTRELGTTIITRGGKLVRRLHIAGSHPIWSPDGRRLAYVSTGGGNTTHVFTISRAGGVSHRVMDFPTSYVSSIAWLARR